MSRFANLPRVGVALVAFLVAFLLALGLALPHQAAPPRAPGGKNDIDLYRAIIEDMRRGVPYEAAAVNEQRAGHYPLKPFVVVRPPALATALAPLPNEQVRDLVLALLGTVTMVACTVRMRELVPRAIPLVVIVLPLFTGIGVGLTGGLMSSFGRHVGASMLHESWAGLFMALSFALRTDKRFIAAVIFGFLAALVRELAFPYLAVMALMALFERRRLEAAAFGLALVAAAGALALHALALAPLVRANDLKSVGWVKFGGWPFVLSTTKWNLIAIWVGPWSTAYIAPLALLGAIGLKNPTGVRLSLLLVGYAVGFMMIGRAQNDYWGILTAPLAGMGLCLAPMALIDLFQSFRAAVARPAPERVS